MLRGGAGDFFHPRRLPRGERGVRGGAPGVWASDRRWRPQRALAAAGERAGERAGALLESGDGFGAR